MSTPVGSRPLITLGRRAGFAVAAHRQAISVTVLVLLTRGRAHRGPGDLP